MKLCTINVECLANMHKNTHHFILPNNDFTDFVYELLGQSLYMAPGRGRQPIGDKNFMTTERLFLFAHMLQVSKWALRNLILHIFNDFIHCNSSGARAEKPLGTNFWCQQKALITSTICCKFQTNLFEFWFHKHFLMFFHMYIASG